MISSAFFPHFEDPVILDYGTYSQTAEALGGGGGSMSTVGFSFGDFSTTFQIPSIGSGSGLPDVRVTLTNLANATEQALQANLGAWQAGQIDSEQARENAWNLLNGMVQRMMQFGAQGYQSAAERDRRIDPARLRWDWIGYYIDPIYVAETGAPAPAGAGAPGGVLNQPPALAGFGSGNLLWIALIVLLAATLLRKRRSA